jgi:hypothetical protein
MRAWQVPELGRPADVMTLADGTTVGRVVYAP